MKLYLSGKINRGCNRILIIHSITTIQSVTVPMLKIQSNYRSERGNNGQGINKGDIRPS